MVCFKYHILSFIINYDETHLTKSSVGDKGGPRSSTRVNPNVPCVGSCVFKDAGGHVTGVFG